MSIKIWVNADESTAYFTSTATTFDGSTTVAGGKLNVWKSEITETGWATPTLFDKMSTEVDPCGIFVDPNDLRRSDDNSDIHYYDPVNDTHTKFDDRVNSTANERTLWTNGRYMVFTSYRSSDPNLVGSYDLYIVNID